MRRGRKREEERGVGNERKSTKEWQTDGGAGRG